ncbi:zinc finger protein 385C-like [Hyalella azteca]|uniref:Zinc finger protein 385C-like n=1 Tax=Hyalella azteca TaxID=294128 RepID=A0A8B7PDB9_HYAAZ|nr:zinc finger protein 385C-like [Hyalella azteca]
MDGFVPEAQALLELEDNAGSNPSRDNYVSPLALSQPTLPIQHYDPAGTYRTPHKPSAKKNYGGYCEICNLRLNSYTQSKSHYEGKPHAKKVKAEQKRKESLSSDGTTDNAPPPCKKVSLIISTGTPFKPPALSCSIL